jgi:hypothetical protein
VAGRLTDALAASALAGTELVEVSQLNSAVSYTAVTISAAAADNSYNDSAAQFVVEGFAVGMRVNVIGFTGNVVNNIKIGIVTALTAGKMTIGGTDGDVIVDDAAGESVTIAQWVSRSATLDDIADFAAVAGAVGGVQSMPVPASGMTPRTTNGAAAGSSETTTNKIMKVTLDFDAATDEFAQFEIPGMPKSWDEGTFTAKAIWTADGGTAAQVVYWCFRAVAISDDDPLDAAFGTEVTVTDALTAVGDVMHSAFSSAITIGGTPQEGDTVIFEVYRDANHASDTLTVDAKLLGVVINFTTNAADDS